MEKAIKNIPELSIIVPVYNMDQFLSRCIDSILSQTFVDFELILVNDGSSDMSGEIISRYAISDKRIISVNQDNKGVSAARNSGLKEASGKYVSFIDADDWIDEKMFSVLIDILNRSDAEIVGCNWNRVFENGIEEMHPVHLKSGMMSAETFVCHLFDSPRSISGSNCNKVFIRSKIRQLYDETIMLCEDNKFLLQYCKGIKKAYYLNQAFYHCYEREGSATRNNSTDWLQMLYTRKELIQTAGYFGMKARNAAECDYLDQCNWVLHLERMGFNEKSVIKDEMRKYIRGHMKQVLMNNSIYWKQKILYCFI